MIRIHAMFRGRPVFMYCWDLRQCLDCLAAFRLAGAQLVEVVV